MGGLTAEYSSSAFIVLLGGFLIFMGIQLFFLIRDGQTLGKKAFSIKIVDANSGKPASWATLIFMRGLFSGVLSVIPYVGTIYALVDALFIFRADKRCIHDHMAGTIVVNA